MERNAARIPSVSSGSKPSTVGRLSPLKPHAIAANHHQPGPTEPDLDDFAFGLLLWLAAVTAVAPDAVDLPFVRGLVTTESQLDSLLARALGAVLGLVAAFTILVRIADQRRLSPLFVAVAGMFAPPLLFSWISGVSRVDLVRPLIVLLVVIALSLCRIQLPRLLWHIRVILRTYLVLCLMLLLVEPDYAWYAANSVGRRLQGLPQFAGIAPHPNALGPIVALALLLELAVGGRRHMRWTFAVLDLAVLVFTHSRAGWAGGIAALSIFLLAREGRVGLRRIWLLFQCVIGAAVVSFFVISNPDSFDITNGRLGLWSTLIDLSGDSWVFGRGLDALSAVNRSSYELATWAGQAHNQFLESYFTGGVLALTALGFLIVVSSSWALRDWPQRGTAAAALAILFIDMMVEAPIRPVLGAPLLMSIFAIAIVSASGERRSGVVVTGKPASGPGSAP